MGDLFLASIPPTSKGEARSFPKFISVSVVRSLANAFFEHSDLAKESSSGAALYSTTTGILAAAHGVSHADRPLLAHMFEERFEGELPPRETEYRAALRGLLTPNRYGGLDILGKLR